MNYKGWNIKLSFWDYVMMGIYFAIKYVLPLLIAATIAFLFISEKPLFELSTGVMNATSAKMSYKGVIWKTWDGWIPIGVNSEGGLKQWRFTATSESVAKCVENNHHVKLYYHDYILTPYKLGYSHQVYKCEPLK